MNVLSIENLSKTLKDEPLFENVNLGLEEGDRVGLIGSNGTGKSTFLKLIAGLMPPDDGKISINKKVEVVLLEQEVIYSKEDTIASYLLNGNSLLTRTYKAYLDNPTDELLQKLDEIDGWNVQKDFEIYLKELKVKESLETKMADLSGGTQKKVSLARLFAMKPSLILMDEPTNHLDIASIVWLEESFKKSNATFIVVTHDRYFLNAVCSQIIEIDRHSIYTHPGNYTAFLERRAARIEALQKEQDRIKTILRRELEWLKRGPKARAGKDSSRKDRISQMLDSQEVIEQAGPANFTSITRRLGKKILEVDNISKSFNGREIVKNFSFSFNKGVKIGIIGSNGTGKTTLLDLLTSTIAPDSGSVDTGINTYFSYYDQQSRRLPQNKQMLEYIKDISENINLGGGYIVSAAKFLELFGFDSSFHRLPIGILSGGEKRRLYLIGCLVSNPNFLVLDEPTNDLDIQTIRRLEQYVIDFEGCVIEVSHDRAFLDQTVDRLFVFKDEGIIENFEGNYSQYLASKQTEQKQKKVEVPTNNYQVRTQKKGLSYKEQKRFDEITLLIEKLEEQQATLEESFSRADNLEENVKTYNSNKEQLEKLNEEWDALASLM